MLKKFIAIIFSTLIIIAGAAFCIEPDFIEVEPNNKPAQANAIRVGQTVIGTFHYGDYDAGDYYTLKAPGKGRMTATVVMADPQCGIMLGALGFHSGRGETEWVPSSSSQPAYIYSKKGDSPITFSFPVQAGQKGYVFVSGPRLTSGGYTGYNWSITACTKDGDWYLVPTPNEKPKDPPAIRDGRRVLPPLQYRLVVTFAAEGQAKGLRVLVQDEQGRPVAGTPVRVGNTPCSAEGTTDGSGVAHLPIPQGCP